MVDLLLAPVGKFRLGQFLLFLFEQFGLSDQFGCLVNGFLLCLGQLLGGFGFFLFLFSKVCDLFSKIFLCGGSFFLGNRVFFSSFGIFIDRTGMLL